MCDIYLFVMVFSRSHGVSDNLTFSYSAEYKQGRKNEN